MRPNDEVSIEFTMTIEDPKLYGRLLGWALGTTDIPSKASDIEAWENEGGALHRTARDGRDGEWVHTFTPVERS